MSIDILISSASLDDRLAHNTQAAILRAVNQLEKRGGWPISAPIKQISIVPGYSIITSWQAILTNNPISDHLRYKNLTIEIGEAIFEHPQAIGSRIIAEGVSSEVVALHLMAHEIFHLTEADRMAQCGITAHDSRTGFALGIRPTMKEDWREIAALLAREFPTLKRIAIDATDPESQMRVLIASDTVSEACADLLGLELLQKVDADWQSLLPALLKIRTEDESLSPDSYRISQALKNITYDWGRNQKVPNEEAIVRDTWEYAFDKLNQIPNLNSELQQKITALARPLSYKANKSRFRWLLGR